MSLTSSLKPRSGVYKPLTIGSHVMVNHRDSRALRNHLTTCRSEHTPKNYKKLSNRTCCPMALMAVALLSLALALLRRTFLESLPFL